MRGTKNIDGKIRQILYLQKNCFVHGLKHEADIMIMLSL